VYQLLSAFYHRVYTGYQSIQLIWTACLPAGVIRARKAHNNAIQPTQRAGEALRFLIFAPGCQIAFVSSQSAVVVFSKHDVGHLATLTDSKGREIDLILSRVSPHLCGSKSALRAESSGRSEVFEPTLQGRLASASRRSRTKQGTKHRASSPIPHQDPSARHNTFSQLFLFPRSSYPTNKYNHNVFQRADVRMPIAQHHRKTID
jgi:hypothetical protein